MRMVVLQKSSRFAFNLINETKSRVKISEGCYENNGNLQEIPMQRAYESMKSFLNISKSLKSRKVMCVATSALRDAPNSKVFLSRIKKDFGLSIKIIFNQVELFYLSCSTVHLYSIYRMWMVWAYTLNFDQVEPVLLLVSSFTQGDIL